MLVDVYSYSHYNQCAYAILSVYKIYKIYNVFIIDEL